MAKVKLTNEQHVNAIVSQYPTIAGHSSKLAYKLLDEKGYEEMENFDSNFKAGFFALTTKCALQLVNISHAKDPLEANGFGEYFDQPFGGIIQRIAVNSAKPVSPGWKGLKNGDSPDPFVVRKGDLSERFYEQNFDYASLITIPDDFQLKTILTSKYGIDEMLAGFMEALRNGYVIQKYLMKLNALNAALNSTKYPLSDTQKVEVELTEFGTREQLMELIFVIRNVVEAMVMAPQTGAFNGLKFKSTQDKGRLKLLLRVGFKNAIAVNVLSSAFNEEQLNLGIDVITVPNFGGLIPYAEAEFITQLYPVYDKLGEQIGYATSEGQEEAAYTEEQVFWKDPNKDVVAILADKGLVFETQQNPYKVEPIRNPRGLYTNFWASSPNNAIHVDRLYNMVAFYAVDGE